MDVARLNFSHGDHETHRRTIRSIREVSRELGREIGILQDLGGPKIRLGTLPVPERELAVGQTVYLVRGESADSEAVPVNYPFLMDDVVLGDRILLADGLVELKVVAKESEKVVCEVLVGGVIQSRKGVNLPTSNLRIPAFTGKDMQDLTLGLEEGVDFVALSFVRHEDDLEPVRRILEKQEAAPLLIAKIEKPQAIERFEKILDRVDGVMVARGDLGVEMPLEQVPMVQKSIIQKTRRAAKPVITATQMLRSMVTSPRPTRAEATDVANAVLDGTDALMLSDETTTGAYPREAVEVLDRIARATEPHLKERDFLEEPVSDLLSTTGGAISRAACRLAGDLGAAAIVAATASGSTARLVARFRPPNTLVGLTPRLATQRQLTLTWGVVPVFVDSYDDTEAVFALARSLARERGIAGPGDRLIVTAGIPVRTSGTTNLVKVLELEPAHP